MIVILVSWPRRKQSPLAPVCVVETTSQTNHSSSRRDDAGGNGDVHLVEHIVIGHYYQSHSAALLRDGVQPDLRSHSPMTTA